MKFFARDEEIPGMASLLHEIPFLTVAALVADDSVENAAADDAPRESFRSMSSEKPMAPVEETEKPGVSFDPLGMKVAVSMGLLRRDIASSYFF